MKTTAERFWAKVNGGDVDTCWEWTGSVTSRGYGSFWVNGKAAPAHLWAYESLQCAVPAGLRLDHLCRNRPCVNPWHLEPVTNRVNILRGFSPSARNALATHCPQGHAYDQDNTYDRRGRRNCRSCRRLANRAAKRAAHQLADSKKSA